MPMHMPIDVLGFIILQKFCLYHLHIAIFYLAVSFRLLMRAACNYHSQSMRSI